MEAADLAETFVPNYQTAWNHNSKKHKNRDANILVSSSVLFPAAWNNTMIMTASRK
jgi:hypothetical protein